MGAVEQRISPISIGVIQTISPRVAVEGKETESAKLLHALFIVKSFEVAPRGEVNVQAPLMLQYATQEAMQVLASPPISLSVASSPPKALEVIGPPFLSQFLLGSRQAVSAVGSGYGVEEAQAANPLRLLKAPYLAALFNGAVEKAVVFLKDYQDNPHLVLVEELLKTRLRELGVEARPFVLSAKLDGEHKSFVAQIMDTLLGNYNLISIDLCNSKALPTTTEVLRDRIREIALQHKPAYLIFRFCSHEDLGLAEEIKRDLSGASIPAYEIDIAGAESLYLAYLLCGQLKKLQNKEEADAATFEKVFTRCLSEKRRKLNELLSEDGGIYALLSRRGANESAEHYLMKVFTVYHIVQMHDLEKRLETLKVKIGTEAPLCNAVADVYYSEKGEVYEIETLYGEGPVVMKKIQETVEKYTSCSNAKIHIVVDNIAALMHFEELWTLQRTYPNISIETLDVDDMRLVPLREIADLFKLLISE